MRDQNGGSMPPSRLVAAGRRQQPMTEAALAERRALKRANEHTDAGLDKRCAKVTRFLTMLPHEERQKGKHRVTATRAAKLVANLHETREGARLQQWAREQAEEAFEVALREEVPAFQLAHEETYEVRAQMRVLERAIANADVEGSDAAAPRAELKALQHTHRTALTRWRKARRDARMPYCGASGGEAGSQDKYTIEKEVRYRKQLRNAGERGDVAGGAFYSKRLGRALEPYEVITSTTFLQRHARPHDPGRNLGRQRWGRPPRREEREAGVVHAHDPPGLGWAAWPRATVSRKVARLYERFLEVRDESYAANELFHGRSKAYRTRELGRRSERRRDDRASSTLQALVDAEVAREKSAAATAALPPPRSARSPLALPSPPRDDVSRDAMLSEDAAQLQSSYKYMLDVASKVQTARATRQRLYTLQLEVRRSFACVISRPGMVYAPPTAARSRPYTRHATDPPVLPAAVFSSGVLDGLRLFKVLDDSDAQKARELGLMERDGTRVAFEMAEWRMADDAAASARGRTASLTDATAAVEYRSPSRVTRVDGVAIVRDARSGDDALPELRLRPYGAMYDVTTATLHLDAELLQRYWPTEYNRVRERVSAWYSDYLSDAMPADQRVANVDATGANADPVYGSGSEHGRVPQPMPVTERLRPRQMVEALDPVEQAALDELLDPRMTEMYEWFDAAAQRWQPHDAAGTRHRWDPTRRAFVRAAAAADPSPPPSPPTAVLAAAAPARSTSAEI